MTFKWKTRRKLTKKQKALFCVHSPQRSSHQINHNLRNKKKKSKPSSSVHTVWDLWFKTHTALFLPHQKQQPKELKKASKYKKKLFARTPSNSHPAQLCKPEWRCHGKMNQNSSLHYDKWRCHGETGHPPSLHYDKWRHHSKMNHKPSLHYDKWRCHSKMNHKPSALWQVEMPRQNEPQSFFALWQILSSKMRNQLALKHLVSARCQQRAKHGTCCWVFAVMQLHCPFRGCGDFEIGPKSVSPAKTWGRP